MKDLSIYIHIPFCKDKCFYCDFLSFKNKEQYIESYIKPLIEEVKGFDNKKDYLIKSIFFGGGTPSLINEKHIVDIINIIFNEYNVDINVEITIEANPGTLTENKLKAYFNCGINRLSIGLQTYQDKLLKSIGRIHTVLQFEENFNCARKVGFKNINIDLIFGLPNQSFIDVKETLKKIVNLSPEHISTYSLIVEKDTKFFKMYEDNNLPLPDEDLEREMYYYTRIFLIQNGYNQYEISNFSKINKECYHNLVYWEQKEYIGFGLGSSSFINFKRFSNTRKFMDYINNKNEITFEELKKEDFYSEYIFLGLRKICGISKNDFYNKFGISIDKLFGDTIREMINLKLLSENDTNLFLTQKGIDLSNYVFSKFL